MSESVVMSNGALVPPGDLGLVDVSIGAPDDPSLSPGQRYTSGLQRRYAGHNLVGSDGLAEIVTMQMTRDQADAYQKVLDERLKSLRARFTR